MPSPLKCLRRLTRVLGTRGIRFYRPNSLGRDGACECERVGSKAIRSVIAEDHESINGRKCNRFNDSARTYTLCIRVIFPGYLKKWFPLPSGTPLSSISWECEQLKSVRSGRLGCKSSLTTRSPFRHLIMNSAGKPPAGDQY